MEKRSLFIQNSLKENLTLSQTKTVVGAERCVQDLLNTPNSNKRKMSHK